MPNLDTRFLADVCQELARQRRLDRKGSEQLHAVQLRYHDLLSKGYAHADRPCDESQATLYSAAVTLAAAAMRLGCEGSPIFHYIPQHPDQEAANAN